MSTEKNKNDRHVSPLSSLEPAVVVPAAARLRGPYRSVGRACRYFNISRSTFYRMLRDWPDFERLIVRLPPKTGPLRVPLGAVEELLERGEASP